MNFERYIVNIPWELRAAGTSVGVVAKWVECMISWLLCNA